MGFVVEITSRSGRVVERHVIARATARLGRGYDNDIILTDPYAAPHHVQLTNDMEGLAVDVLDGDAHTQFGHEQLEVGRKPLPSGAELTIGRTHLRVFRTDHAVPPALPFARLDQWLDTLATPRWIGVFALLSAVVTVGSSHVRSFHVLSYADVALGVASVFALIVLWALVWSLVTRVSRGEPRFFHHVLAALVFVLLQVACDWVVEFLAFNSGSVGVREVADYVATGISLAVLFALSLRFAFRQEFAVRQAFAHGAAWSVVAYMVLTSASFDIDFSSSPEYEAAQFPPGWHIGGTESQAEFEAAARALFE